MSDLGITEADLWSSQDAETNILEDFQELESDKRNNGEDQITSSIIPPPSTVSSSIHAGSQISAFGEENYNLQPPFELNLENIDTTIYPINMDKRSYQENIVRKALMKNVLCALPTGLGKTFIASTVMLNYYRWTKSAKIIFMAPTRPLVSQQIEACLGITGIPTSDTSVMIGSKFGPTMRREEWNLKRVIFATPQIVANDLRSGLIDARSIACIVVDEAHRATGNAAYTDVIKQISEYNDWVSILALTATPGANTEAVQEVIDNLKINTCEIRTEESIDIRQYVHKRAEVHVTIERTEELNEIIQLFAAALKPMLDYLNRFGGLRPLDPEKLTNFPILQASRKFSQSPAGRASGMKFSIRAKFMLMLKLARAMELLRLHGIRPFYDTLVEYVNEQKSKGSKAGVNAKELLDNDNFIKAMDLAKKAIFEEADDGRLKERHNFIGHGKLGKMAEIVNEYFINLDMADDDMDLIPDVQPSQDENGVVDLTLSDIEPTGEESPASVVPPPKEKRSSKIIVFCQWRDSATEIIRVLNAQCSAYARPRLFVGQASTSRSEGMKQKEQQEIIKAFKKGEVNVLVATSIGEEGLDIGQVDLIIFYDSARSSIRNVQRMGRTGRQRAGKVYKLFADEEKDKNAYAAKGYTYIQGQINNSKHFRYVPINSETRLFRTLPSVVYKNIEIPKENEEVLKSQSRGEEQDAVDLLTSCVTSKKRKPQRALAKNPKKAKVFNYPDGVELGIQSARALMESNN